MWKKLLAISIGTILGVVLTALALLLWGLIRASPHRPRAVARSQLRHAPNQLKPLFLDDLHFSEEGHALVGRYLWTRVKAMIDDPPSRPNRSER
jgi:hypothetical protein